MGATSPEIDELIRRELSMAGATLDDDDKNEAFGPSDVASLMRPASPSPDLPQIPFLMGPEIRTNHHPQRRQYDVDPSLFELPATMQQTRRDSGKNLKPVLIQHQAPKLEDILDARSPMADEQVLYEFQEKFPHLASLTSGALQMSDNPELEESPLNKIEIKKPVYNVSKQYQHRDLSHIFGDNNSSLMSSSQPSSIENAARISRQISQFIAEGSVKPPPVPSVSSKNPFLTTYVEEPSEPAPTLSLTAERIAGEVYTIPEEDEEYSSPTAPDGVSSLRRKRGEFLFSSLHARKTPGLFNLHDLADHQYYIHTIISIQDI
jgi:hypothetical protein